MDLTTATDRLHEGIAALEDNRPAWEYRDRYHRGEQDLPYAPPGVSREYLELREMAPANWLKIAMGAPVQRCRAEGIVTGGDHADDVALWSDVWQSNRMGSRQQIVFTESMVQGRGVMSVSADPKTKNRPRVRVESSARVHIEGDPDDPFKPLWAVKRRVEPKRASPLVDVNGKPFAATERAWCYDDTSWVEYVRNGPLTAWEYVRDGSHTLEDVPFVGFDVNVDASGRPHSAIDPLIQAQDAVNMIRFSALLALQFSAYRQRGVSGYDPVMRDKDNNIIWATNPDGTIRVDKDNQPIPRLNTFGRTGVDRMLAFPGKDTKIWDLEESNLANYVTLLSDFLTDLFGRGQIPPQYLLTRMANLSGDALAGAESTLASLVDDLHRTWQESLRQVMRLAERARGNTGAEHFGSQILWADAEARSFSATVDGIVKLVGSGFPRRSAFGMLPGANPQKVAGWMDEADKERRQLDAAVLGEIEREVARTVPDDMPAGGPGS